MPTPSTARPTMTHRDGEFLRNGRPHRILAGALHYFRVHPEQWADRLHRLAAMGLNTVDTYVAWNFHQPDPNAPADFTGRRDLERFIRLAGETGLDVVLRPGPYICAEWDNAGFPAWVTAGRVKRLRCSSPEFLGAVSDWFDTLMPKLAGLQAGNGGPIVAVQVENEYGSYGDDHDYMEWMRSAIRSRGITEMLFTADGPTVGMLDGGTLPEIMAAATLGSRAGDAAALLRSRRDGEPFFVAEYWNGWFDHWGEDHHLRDPDEATAALGEILDVGGSVSIYMAHGGTNFGLTSGANTSGDTYEPTVTSYDSDAPIAEDGRPTAKFHAIRKILSAGTRSQLPQLPPDADVLPAATVELDAAGGLTEVLQAAGDPVAGPAPASFEELGLDAGIVLYRATPELPGDCTLTLDGVRDRAYVFIDGRPAGVVDRNGTTSIDVTGPAGVVDLTIAVENQGRINYGPHFGEGKGLDGARIGGRFIFGWTMVPARLDRVRPGALASDAGGNRGSAAGSGRTAPGLKTGSFDVTAPADTYLALPGYTKGFVWVNDFLLGRYWNVGPQQTLYVPGPVLTHGTNTLTVLELEDGDGPAELVDRPVLDDSRPSRD